jgi:putative redox protein
MRIEPVEIKLSLINEKVKFKAVSSTNQEHPITIDYLPPLGDSEGFLGLELLVMSFAGCVSTGIVGILRKMEKNIKDYSMHIVGNKAENPLRLENIHFEIEVASDNLTDEALQKVMHMAEQISPVWIALRNNVEVTWHYKIV